MGSLPLTESYESSVVMFGPGNWSTQVLVEVWGAAAASARPVCANESRFCTDLKGRDHEAVKVSASSSADQLYNSAPLLLPSLPAMSVSVNVVRDAVDPPEVLGSKATFRSSLSSLTIAFDVNTDRAGLTGTFACDKMIDFSSSSQDAFLGTGSTCAFTSSGDELKITLGRQATIVPGDKLQLLPNLLRASALPNSLTSSFKVVVVEAPSNPINPLASLAPSSTLVGVCDDLILDASGSSGSGGRSMTFSWSATLAGSSANSSTTLLRNVSRYLDEATTAGFQHLVVLPYLSMPPGASFKILLSVSNFIGLKSTLSLPIRKLTVPAPAVSINPTKLTRVTHASALKLTAMAELPKLSCVGGGEIDMCQIIEFKHYIIDYF